MIRRTQAEISKCIIHKVGNKYNSGKNAFSNNLVRFDEDSYELLLHFLLKPFQTVTQSYRFTNGTDIRLNLVNRISKEVFEDDANFYESSLQAVEWLYDQSVSATIKKGDVLVCHFENIEYKDMMVDAIGIFKIENKSNFFQTYQEDDSFDLAVTQGISTAKLDKGALILNTSDAEGTVVLSVDNNNYDAQYWIKNFLQVKYADDKNLHTQQYLEMCKDFSDEILRPEFGKQEQSSFLANTVDYFKENESVDIQDFKEQLFDEDSHKDLFNNYKTHFEKLNDVLIRNNFDVSDAVLKKEKSKLKAEIKLDTNIKIMIDIDSPDAPTEYLEQGYDEDKKMKFYKVFYNEEK